MATYSGTPRTWATGETVTATLLNAEVRDPLAALAGAWNSWTPTLTQGATVSATVQYAKYTRVGKRVEAQLWVNATGTGTAGTKITISLPIAATSPIGLLVGAAYVSQGTNVYAAFAKISSSTELDFTCTNTVGPTASIGAEPSFAIGSGGSVRASVVYEVA